MNTIALAALFTACLFLALLARDLHHRLSTLERAQSQSRHPAGRKLR